MPLLLKVKNLDFKYQDADVLKDIDMEINSQDFVGILGPNGCGKTTLLNNINQWLKPHRGEIYLKNINIKKLKPRILAKHVATVPQDTSIEMNFTVEQVVLMGRNPYLVNFEMEKEKGHQAFEAKACPGIERWRKAEGPDSQGSCPRAGAPSSG